MDILIQLRSSALGQKYEIELPSTSWVATRKMFALLGAQIEVHTTAGELLASLHGELLKLQGFRFTLADGRIYQFECEKIIKSVYSCTGNGESYRLYCHKGFHYSIFQNDLQIAAITEDPVGDVSGISYDLRVNRDANILVVTCMLLVLSCIDGNAEATSPFAVGRIRPEARPFDASWRPTDEIAGES